MYKSVAVVALAAALTGTPALAAETPAGYEPLSVANTTDRVVFCTLIFDGKARTYLEIRPGKTWTEAFDPRRELRLVCQRAKGNAFGPLEPGKSYRLVAAGSKVVMADGAAE